jgi:Spy/CpxP family protein refolding chaperone
MRKIASVLVLVFAFTFTAQAQKQRRGEKRDPLTVEQQTTLMVKRMTLALELTDAQQRKIKPLITQQMTERRAKREEMKKRRDEKKRMEANERFELQNEMLDKRIAFQKEMKSILNSKQYEKFQEMSKQMKKKGKDRMQKMRKMRRFKERKRVEDDDN